MNNKKKLKNMPQPNQFQDLSEFIKFNRPITSDKITEDAFYQKSKGFIKIFNNRVALPKVNCVPPSSQVYCIEESTMKPVLVPAVKSGVFRTNTKTQENLDTKGNIVVVNAMQTKGCILRRSELNDTENNTPTLLPTNTPIISDLSFLENELESSEIYEIVRPFDAGLQQQSTNKAFLETINSTGNVQRKRKKATATDKTTKLVEISKLLTTSRTRCGRVSRPPTYMNKFHNELQPSDSSSRDLRNDLVNKTLCGILLETKPELSNTRRERSIPDCYKCSTCNKIYLGENKRKRHLKAYPDHIMPSYPNPNNSSQESTFDFLMKKVIDYPVEKQQSAFFQELSDFISQFHAIRSKLLACSATETATQYFDKNVSHIFGIQEGSYNINIKAVLNDYNEKKEPSELWQSDKMCPPPPPPLTDPLTRPSVSSDGFCVRYGQTKGLDVLVSGDTAGGISNESLFDTVHDIDLCYDDASRMLGLRKNALAFNDISDNAVEKPITLSPQPPLDFSNLINGT